MALISDRMTNAAAITRRSSQAAGDSYAFAALGLTLLASIGISTLIVPPLLLAFAGGVLLAAGLGLAGLLHLRGVPLDESGVTRRDLAALLVLLGFAAAIMSGPASLLI